MVHRFLIIIFLVVAASTAGAQTGLSSAIGVADRVPQSICDISPDDSMYLYVRAMYCWNGVDARKALDTIRLYVERHPYALVLPGETIDAISWSVAFTGQLPQCSRRDWIDNYNWLVSILPLNSDKRYEFITLTALAYDLSSFDENESANLWWNISLLFPDTGTVTRCWSEIHSLRQYQKDVGQDTTPFHILNFPLTKLPGGTESVSNAGEMSTTLEIVPNPARSEVSIVYEIPSSTLVDIRLFDLHGNERKIAYRDVKTLGNYRLSLKLDGIDPGSYYLRLSTRDKVITRKLILVR